MYTRAKLLIEISTHGQLISVAQTLEVGFWMYRVHMFLCRRRGHGVLGSQRSLCEHSGDGIDRENSLVAHSILA
jgi:hypothetical protein